jgi:hypothetical protein
MVAASVAVAISASLMILLVLIGSLLGRMPASWRGINFARGTTLGRTAWKIL